MKFEEAQLNELITALKAEFKREFSVGEAAEIAERLMLFVTAVHEGAARATVEGPSLEESPLPRSSFSVHSDSSRTKFELRP